MALRSASAHGAGRQLGQRGLHVGRAQRARRRAPAARRSQRGIEQVAAGALRRRQREDTARPAVAAAARRRHVPRAAQRAVLVERHGRDGAGTRRPAARCPGRSRSRRRCRRRAAASGWRCRRGSAPPRASPAAPKRSAMEGRHQRRALAAGGDVAAAQVAHHVDAAELGQQRAVEQLDRVAGAIELPGRWRTVWPCAPMARTAGARPRRLRQQRLARRSA